MSSSEQTPGPIRFGVYEVDLAGRVLRKNGFRVRLQEKPFRLLAMLLARPGEVVTREELIRQLWPDQEYGELESSLGTAVQKVRQALGDSAAHPKWIETIPKVGYRFQAVPLGGSALEIVAGSAPPVRPGLIKLVHKSEPGERQYLWRKYALLGGLLAVGVLTAAFRPWNSAPRGALPELVGRLDKPLTAYPGYEQHPALSPDGTQVAFMWDGENQDNKDIYVGLIAGGPPVRITEHPAEERHPAWSPDGRSLAYLRMDEAGSTLCIAPLSDPRKEREVARLRIPGKRFSYGLDWSPDGRFLVAQNLQTKDGARALFAISVETGEFRPLTNPPASYFSDGWPSVSPDGRYLAFARGRTNHVIHIVELDESGRPVGREVPLTQDPFFIIGVDWWPDSERVVFAGVTTGGRMELRSVDIESRVVSSLLPGQGAEQPSLVRRESDGAVLVSFVLEHADSDLFWFPGPGAQSQDAAPPEPRRVRISTRWEHSVRFSQDGRKLAFVSYSSGAPELWVADADGSNPYQLTNFATRGGASVESPRWSPDDRLIAFEAGLDGHADVFVIGADGRDLRRLTKEPSNEVRPSFSRDGRWLYFTSDKLGPPSVWKMPVDGGFPVRITEGRGLDAFESADRKWLYYAKRYAQFGEKGIYRMPVDGGKEERVLDEGVVGRWALSAQGIYRYRPQGESGPPAIEYYPLDTLEPRTLIELPTPSEGFSFGTANALSATQDDRSVVFVQGVGGGMDLALTTIQ